MGADALAIPRARELTVTEDHDAARIVALRSAVPGIKATAIADRLGLDAAYVRRLLGTPTSRQAVEEARQAALDGATLVLAEQAEEYARTIVHTATEAPSAAYDALRLKAATTALEQLRGPQGSAKGPTVQVNVLTGPAGLQAVDASVPSAVDAPSDEG